MYIPSLKKGGRKEVFLWDTAADINYVRVALAEETKFPSKMEIVTIQTVGEGRRRKVILSTDVGYNTR